MGLIDLNRMERWYGCYGHCYIVVFSFSFSFCLLLILCVFSIWAVDIGIALVGVEETGNNIGRGGGVGCWLHVGRFVS